ncbi:MAG: tetratricopeptide repeat protein, partial [Gemmataceae bacterium]
MNILDTLTQAVAQHQKGDFVGAEHIYRQVLEIDPKQADALNLLGVIHSQTGRGPTGVDLFRKAIALKPNLAEAHFNLGNVLKALNNYPEAIDAYDKAIEFNPKNAESHYNRANTLMELGRWDEAITSYREAIRLRPNYSKAYTNMGQVLMSKGKVAEGIQALEKVVHLEPNSAKAKELFEQARLREQIEYGQRVEVCPEDVEIPDDRREMATSFAKHGVGLAARGELESAIAQYNKALELVPRWPEVLTNRGVAMTKAGKHEAAINDYEKAIQLKPGFGEVYVNLGCALIKLERFAEATEALEKAMQLKPSLKGAALKNLATALSGQGRYEAAEELCKIVLREDPEDSETWTNSGICALRQGKLQLSIEYLCRSLELNPDSPEAHHSLGLTYLTLGQFTEGWAEYEWRFKCKEFPVRTLNRPLWDGKANSSQTIFLYFEQGLGDSIQFVRYAAVVRERVGRVILGCYPSMTRLAKTCPGVDEVISDGAPLPYFDVQAPLMSLPHILETTEENIPVGCPYLTPDADLVARWKEKLGESKGVKIGIAWQGNPKNRLDRFRSVPLRHFTQVTRVDGIRLFSLQKGYGREQIQDWDCELPLTDLGGEFDNDGEMYEVAAVMANLDLVICCDTALAHLAGALGVPVWL